ncbi:MAG: bestrophin family protein [Janthinobacterium lividum]
MIVRPRPSAFELIGIFRLSVLPKIAPQILSAAAFSLVVTFGDFRYPTLFKSFSPAPFTLLGIALSIFLGFRNNVSYDRWWEARRQLGSLIGEVRSLGRLTCSAPGQDRLRREYVIHLTIGYVYALMSHLRGQKLAPEVAIYTRSPLPSVRNLPDALLRLLAAEYAAMLTEGEFTEQLFRSFDERLTEMAAIQVACERLRSTPVPFPYTLLLHRTAYAFCLLLPFGLVGTLGFATPLFVAVVAYAFFGLDELAGELEEPFGSSLNALPLKAMARTAEISLLEALGQTTPEPLVPEHDVLF